MSEVARCASRNAIKVSGTVTFDLSSYIPIATQAVVAALNLITGIIEYRRVIARPFEKKLKKVQQRCCTRKNHARKAGTASRYERLAKLQFT